ncbi:uncharacterized protein LOC127836004 [Dreissena polymorpha]|uniref:uncharacterized protein LOC127836004 n=1 Tax=Dreissena polymorpha TaxID=45954 RepID=UPI0022656D64|nr:uncharacterized protein LOC127836004 [Dreissena polymorpha]
MTGNDDTSGKLQGNPKLHKPGMPLRTNVNEGVIVMMDTVLENNTFSFNDEHFIQTEGTAFGSRLGLNYASTYMGAWEEELFRQSEKQPIAHFRFVDDVWGLWTHEEVAYRKHRQAVKTQLVNRGYDGAFVETELIKVKLVREYDMDKGLSGTATCNITARDTGGFTDTKSFTLTVKKINDIAPEFPHKNYVFFQKPSDTFFTLIANMSGSDADVVDTPTVLTYRFGPTPTSTIASTESHFQIDEDGILYIRNVSTVPDGSYKTFEIIVSDNDATAPLEGTCTVTVIFSGVATTTTTTTERYYVFLDDHENYWWMFLLGALVFAAVVIIIFIACNDPRIYDYVVYQMNRFAHWCRRKPKPKAPRRTVGKLTVTVNNKRLENDPDNALPWELLAKDGDVPELNQVQADIQKRKEKRDRDYKNFKGLPIFEKGKGPRPDSAQSTSSISSDVTRTSESPKYATFVSKDDNLDEGGEGQWGNLEGATGGK